jgi:VanZ family protein
MPLFYEMKAIRGIWIIIALYVMIIYTTLPFMRVTIEYLYAQLGRELLGVLINAAILTLAAVLFLLASRRETRPSALELVPFAVVAAVMLMLDRPEERIHFLEYGLLGLLLVKASGKSTFIFPLLLVILAGSVDEFIQLLLPSRVGDLRDVAMNATGGALGIWSGKLFFWR